MTLNLKQIAYEKDYPDGSGVEFAVRLHARPGIVEFEADSTRVSFPLEQLPWLMGCLEQIIDTDME